MISRSPLAYLRRAQLRPLLWPAPTLEPGRLLVHQYPDPTGKPISGLKAGNGAPPADRVKLSDWSPPSISED